MTSRGFDGAVCYEDNLDTLVNQDYTNMQSDNDNHLIAAMEMTEQSAMSPFESSDENEGLSPMRVTPPTSQSISSRTRQESNEGSKTAGQILGLNSVTDSLQLDERSLHVSRLTFELPPIPHFGNFSANVQRELQYISSARSYGIVEEFDRGYMSDFESASSSLYGRNSPRYLDLPFQKDVHPRIQVYVREKNIQEEKPKGPLRTVLKVLEVAVIPYPIRNMLKMKDCGIYDEGSSSRTGTSEDDDVFTDQYGTQWKALQHTGPRFQLSVSSRAPSRPRRERPYCSEALPSSISPDALSTDSAEIDYQYAFNDELDSRLRALSESQNAFAERDRKGKGRAEFSSAERCRLHRCERVQVQRRGNSPYPTRTASGSYRSDNEEEQEEAEAQGKYRCDDPMRYSFYESSDTSDSSSPRGRTRFRREETDLLMESRFQLAYLNEIHGGQSSNARWVNGACHEVIMTSSPGRNGGMMAVVEGKERKPDGKSPAVKFMGRLLHKMKSRRR